MKLTYRGISYDYEPPTLDMEEGQMGGKYRGQAWKLRYPRHMPTMEPKSSLKYRGVAYGTEATGKAVPVQDQPRQPKKTAANAPSVALLEDMAKLHHENICRRLEHRLQVARERGDEMLVKALEEEQKQMVCSSR
ncbi:DUF4278 domain-containing protein [Geitlerinema sp. PCC 9228]|jgi:hypothetical protein|uniref:arginine synthesis PII-interacting regulator PirA n=1 Tax=Geitlerinema sp. PCC 9228 TaxID=111611 RepID=UPI0008F9A8C6|nr:DUF4278 domain-containing protein [Geitlerinema sp. PCC 9228]